MQTTTEKQTRVSSTCLPLGMQEISSPISANVKKKKMQKRYSSKKQHGVHITVDTSTSHKLWTSVCHTVKCCDACTKSKRKKKNMQPVIQVVWEMDCVNKGGGGEGRL